MGSGSHARVRRRDRVHGVALTAAATGHAFASVAAAVMIAAASAVVLATGVLPEWVGWTGVVLAVSSFVGALFLPGLAALLWVVLVSIVLLTRPRRAAATAT